MDVNRLARDDRGQITTALVIVGTVIVVALGVMATQLGQATDESSQVQNAADASALAAAQQIRADAPGLVISAITAIPTGGGDPFTCGLGRNAATDFAGRADARVVEYCYFPGSDTVSVKVDSVVNSVSGSPARTKADARVGIKLGACVLDLPPVPPPSAPPTPPPTGPPTTTPPPPPILGEAHCGDLVIPVIVDPVTGLPAADLSESEIRDLFGRAALKR